MNTTGKIIVWVIVLVLVIWGIISISKNSDTDSDTIKIGFMGPLSGDTANLGQNAQAAVAIAVDEINNAGGVLGKKPEGVYEDDACNGATAANAISKLINADKVMAVLGGACSGATLGATPVAEAAKIPQLSYCSTNPTISQAGDYIFRNVPSDLFQAKYAAEYQIKAKNSDAVYFVSYTDPAIAGLKQARDLGIKTQFFGADAWDDTKVWSELGTLGNGAMYTIVGSNSSVDFKVKMKARLGKDDLIYCSNYAYDGLKILADAITRANSTDGTAIKDALYKTDYTGGVSAKTMTFDANGNPVSAAYIVKVVKDGKAAESAQ